MDDTVRKALSSMDLIREAASKQLSIYTEYLRGEGIDAKTEIAIR